LPVLSVRDNIAPQFLPKGNPRLSHASPLARNRLLQPLDFCGVHVRIVEQSPRAVATVTSEELPRRFGITVQVTSEQPLKSSRNTQFGRAHKWAEAFLFWGRSGTVPSG